MITSKAHKQLGLIRRSFTTNCFSAKNSISPWCDLPFCITHKPGDHAFFRIYYSLKEFIGELQSIFLMTILHLTAPDFLNYQFSLPLIYIFELNDLLFLIKLIKNLSPHFDVTKWIHLTDNITRSLAHLKLVHKIN